jgi:CspA family cold shock protein
MTTSHGTVKAWKSDRGFGFICRDGDSDDFFVHISAVEGKRELQPDQRVEFMESADNSGRKRAINVKVL